MVLDKIILPHMATRERCISRSPSLPVVPTSYHLPESLKIRMPRSNYPRHDFRSDLVSDKTTDHFEDRASIGSPLSDDMDDEKEIFVHLNPRAMAAIPMRLRKIMQEIQAERYERLRKEDPNLRIMPTDYWIRPVKPVKRKPISYNRAPTPLYFALPPIVNKRNGAANATVRVNPAIQSLGPGYCHRWAAHPGVSSVPLQIHQHQVSRSSHYRTHSAQPLRSHQCPPKEFCVISGYRQPVPPNLMVNQKLRKHKDRRPFGLRSLSVKPVASNLRDSLKRSFSRLNRWMTTEI